MKEINLSSIGKEVMGRMKKTIRSKFPMLENETITSNYTEFKRWAIEYGTTKLFKEEKFKAPSDIEYTLEEATDMGAGIMFFVLTEIWKMWSEENIENTNEFGKELFFTMKKDDFFFDKEAMGAETALDRQNADYLNQTYGVEMNEKKIGFNRGPEYSEETEDLLNDFAKSTEMISKELNKKIVDSDDPKVQEILNLLDNNLDPEFIDDLEAVYNLIQELPDKPTETPKVGFRSSLQEKLQIRAGIIK